MKPPAAHRTRLRIALDLKGLGDDYVAVDLGTEQLNLGAAYKALNPQGPVPALQFDADEWRPSAASARTRARASR